MELFSMGPSTASSGFAITVGVLSSDLCRMVKATFFFVFFALTRTSLFSFGAGNDFSKALLCTSVHEDTVTQKSNINTYGTDWFFTGMSLSQISRMWRNVARQSPCITFSKVNLVSPGRIGTEKFYERGV